MSNYDDLKEEILNKVKATAIKYVPDLCKALKNEGLSNEDIKDRIRKDFIGVWSRTTIDENIPKEFLSAEKVARSKRSADKIRARKQTVAATTEGGTVTETYQEDSSKLQKQLQTIKQTLKQEQDKTKEYEQEIRELQASQLELAVNPPPKTPAKTTVSGEPKIHFHIVPLKDRQFFHDALRFAKAENMVDEVYAKIENNMLVRILSLEEKDKELEALVSI